MEDFVYIVQTRIARQWVDYAKYGNLEQAKACFDSINGEYIRIVRSDGIEFAIKY
jgi:hypothetical protein